MPPEKPKRRLPPWLKRRLPAAGRSAGVRKLLDELKLTTVCEGAECPNRGECYACGTATFMILGESCTRDCRFCAVPHNPPGPPRVDEPAAVAEAAAKMGLDYVVVTSVTRDDLHDGGAEHFAKTIRAIRAANLKARIEVLTPDFGGRVEAIETVVAARPDVFNHNVETVPRLYPLVRRQADYDRSLAVLSEAKAAAARAGVSLLTKSGLMVGLGETEEEVLAVFADLRDIEVDVLTVGQYLSPSDRHLPVAEFIPPEQFDVLKREAMGMGFLAVAAGPFVRSSYHAKDVFESAE